MITADNVDGATKCKNTRTQSDVLLKGRDLVMGGRDFKPHSGDSWVASLSLGVTNRSYHKIGTVHTSFSYTSCTALEMTAITRAVGVSHRHKNEFRVQGSGYWLPKDNLVD